MEDHSKWIVWDGSMAQVVVESDLTSGRLPVTTSPMTAWKRYKDRDEFALVPLDQFRKEFLKVKKSVAAKNEKSLWIVWEGSAAEGRIIADWEERVSSATPIANRHRLGYVQG